MMVPALLLIIVGLLFVFGVVMLKWTYAERQLELHKKWLAIADEGNKRRASKLDRIQQILNED